MVNYGYNRGALCSDTAILNHMNAPSTSMVLDVPRNPNAAVLLLKPTERRFRIQTLSFLATAERWSFLNCWCHRFLMIPGSSNQFHIFLLFFLDHTSAILLGWLRGDVAWCFSHVSHRDDQPINPRLTWRPWRFGLALRRLDCKDRQALSHGEAPNGQTMSDRTTETFALTWQNSCFESPLRVTIHEQPIKVR